MLAQVMVLVLVVVDHKLAEAVVVVVTEAQAEQVVNIPAVHLQEDSQAVVVAVDGLVVAVVQVVTDHLC